MHIGLGIIAVWTVPGAHKHVLVPIPRSQCQDQEHRGASGLMHSPAPHCSWPQTGAGLAWLGREGAIRKPAASDAGQGPQAHSWRILTHARMWGDGVRPGLTWVLHAWWAALQEANVEPLGFAALRASSEHCVTIWGRCDLILCRSLTKNTVPRNSLGVRATRAWPSPPLGDTQGCSGPKADYLFQPANNFKMEKCYEKKNKFYDRDIK